MSARQECERKDTGESVGEGNRDMKEHWVLGGLQVSVARAALD